MELDRQAFAQTLRRTRRRLEDERTGDGHWVGRLSTSALSTATATAALALADARRFEGPIRGGLDWLAAHQNADGGWGDTPISKSNINTTALGWAALALAPEPQPRWTAAAEAAGDWLRRRSGTLDPAHIAGAILAFYGRDRTFSTPILTLLALCGRLGPREQAFRHIPALPFELAATPHWVWRFLRLPVVSYALPALVAIGQARHHFAPTRWPGLRALRTAAKPSSLRVVRGMQAGSGGFLEAVPLTSFVTACLTSIGYREHPITTSALAFLMDLRRDDGGWPIDTCLSTWVTTLAVHALAGDPGWSERMDEPGRRATARWLLDQQYDYVHPFTHAAPGGWSWMETDGAVPDADDTPGVLLALRHLLPGEAEARAAADRGVDWLAGLQNRDGGIPTFCRGWGKLPFDRSAPDTTAHTVRAWRAWLPELSPVRARRIQRALRAAVDYLRRSQRPDGAWVPLWFGNEWIEDDQNPTYGTARVLQALAGSDLRDDPMAQRGLAWLLAAQGPDGGWGGGPGGKPSIEETSLAVEAICGFLPAAETAVTADDSRHAAVARGVAWLIRATDAGRRFDPAPIGLYFAKLWYHERLYPVVWCLSALETAARACPDLRAAAAADLGATAVAAMA